ncbi:MAG: FtsB family cell division protein [Bacteroidota bacterium]
MKFHWIDRIPAWLKNKYALTFIAFLIWMAFFDRNDFIVQYRYRSELKALEADKAYFTEQIAQNKRDMEDLMSDPEHLEKYAREKYLMKKDNEDIFLIEKVEVQEED